MHKHFQIKENKLEKGRPCYRLYLSFVPLQMLQPETPCVACFLFLFSLEVIRSFARHEPARLIKVEDAVYGNHILRLEES